MENKIIRCRCSKTNIFIKMRIYKLRYTDKETAIADLIAKGVYQEIEGEMLYADDIDAVVEVGLIIV